jgi:hypothetical protein
MENADKKLKNGLESIYDWVPRPFKGFYLKSAVTQDLLQGLRLNENFNQA